MSFAIAFERDFGGGDVRFYSLNLIDGSVSEDIPSPGTYLSTFEGVAGATPADVKFTDLGRWYTGHVIAVFDEFSNVVYGGIFDPVTGLRLQGSPLFDLGNPGTLSNVYCRLSVSPDGTRVAYTRDVNSSHSFVLANIDDTNKTTFDLQNDSVSAPVLVAGGGNEPLFSSDSKYVFVQYGGEDASSARFYVFDVATGAVVLDQQSPTAGAFYYDFVYNPDDNQYYIWNVSVLGDALGAINTIRVSDSQLTISAILTGLPFSSPNGVASLGMSRSHITQPTVPPAVPTFFDGVTYEIVSLGFNNTASRLPFVPPNDPNTGGGAFLRNVWDSENSEWAIALDLKAANGAVVTGDFLRTTADVTSVTSSGISAYNRAFIISEVITPACPPFWTAFYQTREIDLCPTVP
jgi:hypothetical protein